MGIPGRFKRRSFLKASSAMGTLALGSTWSTRLLADNHLPDPSEQFWMRYRFLLMYERIIVIFMGCLMTSRFGIVGRTGSGQR